MNLNRLIFFLLPFPLLFAMEVPEPAVELHQRYEEAIKGLESVRDQQHEGLSKSYAAALQRRKDLYQRAGDLDAMMAASEELTRFEPEGTPPTGSDASGIPELREIQRIVVERFADFDQEFAENSRALRMQYLEALKTRVTQLTTQGEIDAAIVVRDYRNHLAAQQKELDSPADPGRNLNPQL